MYLSITAFPNSSLAPPTLCGLQARRVFSIVAGQGIRKLAHIHDEALGGVKDLLSQVERATTLPQLLDAFVGYV